MNRKDASVLDKILTLVKKPEERAPRDKQAEYRRRRWREHGQTKFHRAMTDGQRRAVKASIARRKKDDGGRTVWKDGRCTGRFHPLGTRGVDKIVRLMEPGRWYAGPDLMRAAGANEWHIASLREQGYVTRARTLPWPAKRHPEWRKGKPVYLYRLSPLGEEIKRALEVLGV